MDKDNNFPAIVQDEEAVDPIAIVRGETEKLQENHKLGLLEIKPMYQWNYEASQKPDLKKIFGPFLGQGEVGIFFAGTGIGKTILSYQIADAYSRGENAVTMTNECEPSTVLFLDCELSAKQQQKRYSDLNGNLYRFNDNFLRAELVYDDLEQYSEDGIIRSIEQALISHPIKLIVVDNISYLQSDAEKAKHAAKLMKYLKGLKEKHHISILVIAHTPKRDESREISVNDLAGSKALSNFADTIFAMGQSNKDHTLRYIKQIKSRNTELIYHLNNVVVLRMCRVRPEFLGFELVEYGYEKEHLKRVDFEKDRETLQKQVQELSEKGLSQRDIQKELGISLGVVNKYLKVVHTVHDVHLDREREHLEDDEKGDLPF